MGALQAKGLAVDGLDWRLSDDLDRRSRDAALRQAIAMLHARAAEAAGPLGLRFDEERRGPIPPHAMMAMKPAPPTAVGEDITVSATASAEAILQPK